MKNQPRYQHRPKKSLRYMLRILHIWSSLLAVAPLIMFCLTGIVLNHKKFFEMPKDKQIVAIDLKLDARSSDSIKKQPPLWLKISKELHNGKAFGALGKILLDVFAVCLLICAVSGIALYALSTQKTKLPINKQLFDENNNRNKK